MLGRIPYRDADLIVTLFTREHGKLSAIARGARRSKNKRFGGRLALFTVGPAELRARRGDLWTLSSFDSTRDFTKAAADIAVMAHGSYGLELVRELTAPEQPEPEIFDLVVELFEVLSARGASPSVLRVFELRLLRLVGLAPSFDRCVGCATTDDLGAEGATLDGVRGGVACRACRVESGSSKPLSAEALALLRQARDAGSLADAPADGGPGAAQARDAVLAMLLAQIGKPLRSVQFIAKMSASMLPSAHGDA